MSDPKAVPSVMQVAQLSRMAELYPDEIGYRVVGGDHLTFAGWEHESNQLARGLTGAGVGHGDRVAICLQGGNALRWVIAYAAIHKAGAAVVPLDPRLAPAEIESMLARAAAAALVVDGPYRPAAPVLVIDASPGGRTPAPPTGGGRGPESGVTWDEILDPDGTGYQIPVEADDLSDILFTSGTTGRPKGVAVRHANASAVPNGRPGWNGSKWLHASPMATFAGVSFVYSPMKLGMTSVHLPRFDAGAWIEFVESEGPQAVFLVPAMVQLLFDHPRFDEADLSAVRVCAVGSAPLSPLAVDRLQERMPDALVSNNYGMTEAGSVYCLMEKGEAAKRPGSVGKPLPPAEVRCIDADGRVLPAGDFGEIQLRIPGRQREYLDDPEATAETWVDGWLRTGDIGCLDVDGYLYIGGRAKDVIIRGGSNLYAI
ncbi:MAG: class I adenylate-forming enzyme family protein, partial [Acidimicrobiales bacterium]